ncbi:MULTISPECIES: hypothetical protein [Streptomyces]|uniref:hypothetical protein n=1 Tax=Streptomyces TaxID=1883 RepID=UPI0037019A3E
MTHRPHPVAQSAAQQRPAEGDRYVKRAEPDADRIVTVRRVWTADDGNTAVAYEWDDPRVSYAGSACPLDVFNRTYRPADDETRLTVVDGRDALAFVIIRPAADDRVSVEAGSRGMSKAAAAYALRNIADRFDEDARADGDEPISYPAGEQAAREVARDLAEQVEALGKARGWSTWAADYLHPDREFVDTGAPEDQAQHCAGAAIDHDETGICNHEAQR